MLYNNKKITEIDEIITLLNDNSNKKCLINISIEYYGLYIYSESTSNKWVITKIDITNIDDEESIVSIDELIDNYIDRTRDINIKCKNKLQELTNDIENIKKNMKDIDNIIDILDNKDITNKTRINNNLIKLNELILKQETIIKTSH
jgi:polyhydroxyalkanoate synthesis regulator phasin